MKKIFLNDLYDDYVVIEELGRKNGHNFFKLKCKKCGHIKICADCNLLKQNNQHSKFNCKEDFYKTFIGKQFNDYECIGITKENESFKLLLKCSQCGKNKKTKLNEIEKGYKHSPANCKENYYNNFIGKQFGDFEVLKIKEKKYGDVVLVCECLKCKTKIDIKIKNLKKNIKHGHICFKNLKNDEYKKIIAQRFYNMKQRCENPNNNNFIYYGGRNIKLNYEYPIDMYYDFIEELKEHCKKYGIKNSTFDRIDVNGNYEKNNLRITTQEIQNVNCTDKKFFILKKDKDIVIFDSAMNFGKKYGLNGRSVGNLLRGQNKSLHGWELVKIIKNVSKQNLNEIIKQEGVTTNLIISL